MHLLVSILASINQHFSEIKYFISAQRKIVPISDAYLNGQRIFATFISAPDVLTLTTAPLLNGTLSCRGLRRKSHRE